MIEELGVAYIGSYRLILLTEDEIANIPLGFCVWKNTENVYVSDISGVIHPHLKVFFVDIIPGRKKPVEGFLLASPYETDLSPHLKRNVRYVKIGSFLGVRKGSRWRREWCRVRKNRYTLYHSRVKKEKDSGRKNPRARKNIPRNNRK